MIDSLQHLLVMHLRDLHESDKVTRLNLRVLHLQLLCRWSS